MDASSEVAFFSLKIDKIVCLVLTKRLNCVIIFIEVPARSITMVSQPPDGYYEV